MRGDLPAETLIESHGAAWSLGLHDLWAFRELTFILALRDVKVRYAQTVLGAAWAVLQPGLTMLIFSFFFGHLANMQALIKGDIPYSLVTLCALLPWQLFSGSLTNAGNSLVSNQNLITKVYFPRLVIPLASALAPLVDFAIACALLVLLWLGYGAAGVHVRVPASIVLAPFFAGLALLSSFALGLWLAALNVRYRDVRHAIPFLVQMLLFVSPVAYPSEIVRAKSEWLYALYGLNPVVGIVDGFRWAVLGTPAWPGPALASSTFVTIVALAGGLMYFSRTEQYFADLV